MTKQQVKNNIDTDIRLKTTTNSISPENVGKNMKDIVDLIPDFEAQNLINNIDLKVSWKNGDTKKIKTPTKYSIGVQSDWVFTRNGFMYMDESLSQLTYDGIKVLSSIPYTFEVNDIQNLLINIKDFKKIKNFNPKLVITKYKPSRKKGLGINNTLEWRTSGFKDNKSLNNSFKPSRINLLGVDNIIDFGQEYYFYIGSRNNRLQAKGVNGKYSIDSRRSDSSFGIKTSSAYVYIQLNLSLTINNKEYISIYPTTVKMTLDGKKDVTDFYVNSTIKFKFA